MFGRQRVDSGEELASLKSPVVSAAGGSACSARFRCDGVKLFTYPTPKDQCILVRTGEEDVRRLQPEMYASVVRSLLFG